MAKKKKEQAVQEEPIKTVKTAAEEKPAKEKKTEAKAEVKSEQQTEQKAEAKQERKPREPQMITANGEKVSHGHAFQSTTNPADWYFTAKMDGVQLKPQKMDAADLAAYQKKEMTVPQLMEKYYLLHQLRHCHFLLLVSGQIRCVHFLRFQLYLSLIHI